MNVLLIDATQSFLDFAIRCARAGHVVRWFVGPLKNGNPSEVGRGFTEFERVPDFKPHLRWADLILCSDNVKYLQDLVVWRRRGLPILAPSPEATSLELLRDKGQESFKSAGLDVMPSTSFEDYDTAIEFVKKNMKRYVSKPDGDADKALSYVSKSPQDMVSMLMRWKKTQKQKREFILQEFVPGIEMAVGGWFGSHGFNEYVLENFEFKKLMNDDLGCNTGEQGCYDEETEVLTDSGWKYWRDVNPDDELATLVDGETKFEKPSALVQFDVDGPMVRWKNRSIDILVTPNHNMYVQKQRAARKKSDEYEFILAEDCTQSQYSIKRTGSWTGQSPEYFVLPGNEWSTGIGVRHTPEIKVPFDKWCSFLGIYMAEGYSGKHQAHIAQSHPGKCEKVKALLDGLPFRVDRVEHGFRINCAQLARVVKPFGRSHEKRVPDYIKGARPEHIAEFLDAFSVGDAHEQANGSRMFYTSNKGLADDLQELMLRCGSVGVIKGLKKKEALSQINGRTIYQRRTAYVVYERKRKTQSWLDARDRKIVDYKGKVYCATVSSHVLFVRRNGKPLWCGNTVIKYVKQSQSKLFKETLAKVEQQLHGLDYKGFVDISVIVDSEGKARPLEYTMRPGWPLFNIQQAVHREPVEFLKALAEGKDDFEPYTDHALGVVLTIPDYPYSHLTNKEVTGYPVYYLDDDNPFRAELHPCELMCGEAPTEESGKIVMRDQFLSAGDYLLVATGIGKSVREAKDWAYQACESVEIPNSVGYRTDIGNRLEEQLPILQEHGYATAWEW